MKLSRLSRVTLLGITVLTLLMFPILLVMYGRLAVKEEAEMRAQFGTAFDSYAKQTPRFFPRFLIQTTEFHDYPFARRPFAWSAPSSHPW